jgi:hypothetical protein
MEVQTADVGSWIDSQCSFRQCCHIVTSAWALDQLRAAVHK